MITVDPPAEWVVGLNRRLPTQRRQQVAQASHQQIDEDKLP